jgi:hypothetical protein
MPTPRHRFELVVLIATAFLILIGASSVIGSAIFLSDQLDQLVSFEALIEGNVTALYGPIMSGTNPAARALAPVGAVVFGLPTLAGLDPDMLHLLFLIFLTGALGVFCHGMLKVDRAAGIVWTSLVLMAPAFWWASSLLWLSIVPFWCSLLAVGCCASYVGRRQPHFGPVLVAFWLASLSMQLTTVVGWPLILVFLVMFARDRPWQGVAGWRKGWSVALPALLLAPYAIAEVLTGFGNTQAIMVHLASQSGSGSHAQGLAAAFDSLAVALEPFRLLSSLEIVVPRGVLVLWFLVLAGVAYLSLRWLQKTAFEGRIDTIRFFRAMFVVYLVAVPGQMVFFFAMNRPLLGAHYTLWLTPVYMFPYVVAISAVLSLLQERRRLVLSCAVATVAALIGVVRAEKAFELSPWNFQGITTALSTITERYGSVNTIEPLPPFSAFSTRDDTLLMYVMEHYVPGAEVASEPDAVLVPERYGEIEALVVPFGGATFRLEEIVPPGIGVYLRAPPD